MRVVPNTIRKYFQKDFNLLCSDKCCYKLKKEPAHRYEKENNRNIVITGMRKEEGGNRNNINCTVFSEDTNELRKFHPLSVIDNNFEKEFIKKYNIKLCDLYYEPFNFKRTGCVACPFALGIQEQLDKMYEFLPNEYNKAIKLWRPVYDIYIKNKFRLKCYSHNKPRQTTIFDFIDEDE